MSKSQDLAEENKTR